MIAVRRRFRWLIALLLLAFVGQSVAAVAMPCRPLPAAPADMPPTDHAMVHMHHDMSRMGHPDKPQDTAGAHGCCHSAGHCVSGNCSLPALGFDLAVDSAANRATIADTYASQIPQSPVVSLYRPPIFR